MNHEQSKLGRTYDRVFYAALVGFTAIAVGLGFFCAGV